MKGRNSMAEEVEAEGGEEQKKGNPLMIILIVLIVILMAAIGGIGYLLYSKGFFDDQPKEENTEKVEKKEADEENAEFFKTEIKDLVLNITNAKGKEKLMKLSFSIKSVEPTIEAIVSENKDEVIDIVIQQISARSSEELLTVGGKELLKEELIDELNAIVNEATSSNEDIKRNNIKKLFLKQLLLSKVCNDFNS
jgi:flagellar FliL protein